jgi:geranylgeranyl diphosphate synthase type II
MAYTLLAPGKRIRPVTTLLIAQCLGADLEQALSPACSIEMIHAASLIIDDLPCMDDARLRRGRQTNHVAFGEHVAILAAFGLVSEAINLVSRAEFLEAHSRTTLCELLSRTIGIEGLVGGQAGDLASSASQTGHLELVHGQKTGSLFVAAAEAGALLAGASPRQLEAARTYAIHLGIAFQALDDLVDCFELADDVGKDVSKDVGKPTMLTMVGRDRAIKRLGSRVSKASSALKGLGADAKPLDLLAQSVFNGAMDIAYRSPRSVSAP